MLEEALMRQIFVVGFRCFLKHLIVDGWKCESWKVRLWITSIGVTGEVDQWALQDLENVYYKGNQPGQKNLQFRVE